MFRLFVAVSRLYRSSIDLFALTSAGEDILIVNILSHLILCLTNAQLFVILYTSVNNDRCNQFYGGIQWITNVWSIEHPPAIGMLPNRFSMRCTPRVKSWKIVKVGLAGMLSSPGRSRQFLLEKGNWYNDPQMWNFCNRHVDDARCRDRRDDHQFRSIIVARGDWNEQCNPKYIDNNNAQYARACL